MVPGGQPRTDDPQTVDDRAELDRLGGDLVLGVHCQHDLARLVGLDRIVGDQQRTNGAAVCQAHVAEHAGREEIARIGEHGAAPDGAGTLVEPIVGEVEIALPTVAGLVLKLDLDGGRCGAGTPGTLGLEVERLGAVKGEIDRIERVDRGQHRAARAFAARDLVAGIDLAIGNAATDRRANLGELDVERARADPRIRCGKRGLRRRQPRPQRVDLSGRHRVVVDQPRRAAKIGPGQRQRTRRTRRIGVRLGKRVGERAGIDREEQLALTDDLAVAEVDAGHLTGNTRPDLDGAARGEAADIIVPFADVAHQWRRHRHRGGWRCGGDGLVVAGELGADRANQRKGKEDKSTALPARQTGNAIAQGPGASFIGRVDRRDHVHAADFRPNWPAFRPTGSPVTLATSVSSWTMVKPAAVNRPISDTGSAWPRRQA